MKERLEPGMVLLPEDVAVGAVTTAITRRRRFDRRRMPRHGPMQGHDEQRNIVRLSAAIAPVTHSMRPSGAIDSIGFERAKV